LEEKGRLDGGEGAPLRDEQEKTKQNSTKEVLDGISKRCGGRRKDRRAAWKKVAKRGTG